MIVTSKNRSVKKKYTMDLVKMSYCKNKTEKTNTSQDVSEGFYPEWKDNEIRKLYFAFALIKKRGFIFPIRECRREK